MSPCPMGTGSLTLRTETSFTPAPLEGIGVSIYLSSIYLIVVCYAIFHMFSCHFCTRFSFCMEWTSPLKKKNTLPSLRNRFMNLDPMLSLKNKISILLREGCLGPQVYRIGPYCKPILTHVIPIFAYNAL
jgi:hypothetical protein